MNFLFVVANDLPVATKVSVPVNTTGKTGGCKGVEEYLHFLIAHQWVPRHAICQFRQGRHIDHVHARP